MTATAAPVSLDRLAAATPATRDRTVDFLRAASMLVVAFGHWLMAMVVVDDGTLRGDNVIAHVPGLWLLTWVLQVMPIFFFVGGFSNSVTLDAYERRRLGYATYLRSRVARLLRPVLVLVVAWTAAALALQLAGVADPMLRAMTRAITGPLWFVAVYLGVVAMAPVMLALHRRFGAAVLVVLGCAALVADAGRIGAGWGEVGALNLAFVWLLVHQLGFFYADGSLLAMGRRAYCLGVVAGLGALVLLTQVGPYPSSMVGLPGEEISNIGPPTICVLALATLQISLVMLARPALARWLDRPRPWRLVIAASSVMMTIYCWHMTALLLGVGLLRVLGLAQAEVGTTAWWVVLPAWLGLLAVLLVPLVAVFARFERPTGEVASGGAAAPAAFGAVALVLAFGGFAATGLAPLTATATVIAWPMTPLTAGACLFAGLGLVRRAS